MAFDANYYLQKNPDVAAAVARGEMTPEQHYQQFGVNEGRSPEKAAEFLNPSTYYSAVAPGVPQFTSAQLGTNSPNVEQNQQAYSYLLGNPDVAEAVKAGKMTAQEHYNQFGKAEGRAWDTSNLPKYNAATGQLEVAATTQASPAVQKQTTQLQTPQYAPQTTPSLLSTNAYSNLPAFTKEGGYVSPQSLVSNQLEALLAKGSPLMNLAESRAREKANQLGLLSSSMAVGAGQKAIYDQMVPIAAANAERYGASDLSGQNAYQQERLTGLQGNISGILQAQQDAAALQRTREEQAAQTYRQQLVNNASLQELGIKVDADTSLEGLRNLATISDNYTKRLMEIDSTPDSQLSPEAKAAMKAQLNTSTSSTMKAITDLSKIKLDWEPAPASMISSTSGTTTSTATTNTPAATSRDILQQPGLLTYSGAPVGANGMNKYGLTKEQIDKLGAVTIGTPGLDWTTFLGYGGQGFVDYMDALGGADKIARGFVESPSVLNPNPTNFTGFKISELWDLYQKDVARGWSPPYNG